MEYAIFIEIALKFLKERRDKMTREEKMRIYRRRQAVLLICIGAVLVVLIALLIIIFVSKDSEPIKDPDSLSIVQSDEVSETEEIPVDGGNSNLPGSIYFKEKQITIKVGESYTAEVVNETGSGGGYIWESSNSSVATVDGGIITGQSLGSCDITVKISATDKSAQLRVYVESAETDSEHEVIEENGLTYIDGILIANKTYSLPADYDPGASEEALEAFSEMAADAAAEGLDIYISSGYRSYYDQERIYNNYVAQDGQEVADTYSSRPGHSDHQTGLAFDLNSIDDSFGYTPESDWVAANAHRYGFIIRFPEGKEEYTGYQYEPWHIRYLGIDKATEVYESGLSLEEFLGIDSEYKD